MDGRLGRPAALLLCLVLAGCERSPGPALATGAAAQLPAAPPVPTDLGDLDPLLRAAIEEHVATVRVAPASAAVWRALGELYQANGFYTEAEAAFAGAIARDPADPLAWYGRALSAVFDGRAADARVFAARSLELDPTYAPGFWRVGEWCLADGLLDEAVAWYGRAIDANAAHPGGWIGLARVHLQRGEFEPAAEILATRVLGGPCDGYGRQLLATAFQRLGRVEDARVLAAQGRGAQPVLADPRWSQILAKETGRRAEIERANALVRQGRAAEAVPVFERLSAAAPGDAATLSNLAFALLEAGRAVEALERARAASALDEHAYRPLLIQGLALRRRGPASLPEAVGLLYRAVERMPTAADAHSALALCLTELGQDSAALDSYRRAAQLDPDNVELLQNAGLLERRLGLYKDAERTYRAFLELAPGHAGATAALAESVSGLGDHAQAEALLRGLLDQLLRSAGPAHPDVRPVRERLIAALEAQGKAEEAAAERAAL